MNLSLIPVLTYSNEKTPSSTVEREEKIDIDKERSLLNDLGLGQEEYESLVLEQSKLEGQTLEDAQKKTISEIDEVIAQYLSAGFNPEDIPELSAFMVSVGYLGSPLDLEDFLKNPQ
jgi:hypothetical protein